MEGLFFVEKCDLSVGRLPLCDISFEEIQEMSGRHIVINRKDGNEYMTMEGKNGGYVRGHFVRRGEIVTLLYGDVIEICGVRLLWLSDYIYVDANGKTLCTSLSKYDELSEFDTYTINDKENYVESEFEQPFFSKSPRIRHLTDDGVIELEAPPEKRIEEAQSQIMTIGPAFTMAIPMLLGFLVARLAAKESGGMSSAFMYTGIVTSVSSAFLGIVWGVINLKNRKESIVRQEEKRKRIYTEYVRKSETLIKERYNKNASTLFIMYPHISEYVSDSYNRFLLWNKNPSDDDYLKIRVGIGNIHHKLNITIPKERFSLVEDDLRSLPKLLKDKYSILRDVPVTIDLRNYLCSGIVCKSKTFREEIVTMLALSLAVTVSPLELKIIFIFEKEEICKELTKHIRFLPHMTHIDKLLVSFDSISKSHIISTINEIIEDDFYEEFVIFTDCYEKISRCFIENNKLHFIAVSDRFENMPSDCRLIIQKDETFSGTICLSSERSVRTEVHFDKIDILRAENYSRVLQEIKIPEIKGKNAIPDKVSFLDLFKKSIDYLDILSFWVEPKCDKQINAPIGVSEDGKVLFMDFHERGIGPHGLVAGMTGSGKSEVLQTIILSLSVMHSPEEIGFFLIDYKGGGMAQVFEKLPHVMGSISNLSGQMIYRAMASVKSENERRQRIFASVSVNNISEYQRMYVEKNAEEPLPHIFIIIDEFAELKKEEPEFMKELISVARVGRSLGIHLILATQKPTGVVDDNIQSNSRFRICLKLQDRNDSMEMLHKPDAAMITNPGRAILQVGNDEMYTMFQGAYTMDKSLKPSTEKNILITDEYGNRYERINEYEESQDLGIPQISRIISEIVKAEEKYNSKERNPLWLKPLSRNLVYDGDAVSIGIYDNPSRQTQNKIYLNITHTGHHIIVGTLGSGKSTLLSTISFALLSTAENNIISMYFIDYSHGLFLPFKDSVFTGGYIHEDNEEDIEKLMILLNRIISERKELLKGGNYRQYIEREENSNKISAVYIIIDGLGTFRERTQGAYDKDIEHILRSGEALGIFVIATAYAVSSQEVTRKMFESFKVCIPLQLKDKYEYKEALMVQMEKVFMPEEICGRGLFISEGDVVEFQAYQPTHGENDFERFENLKKAISDKNHLLSKKFSLVELSKHVRKIPHIPKGLTMKLFIEEIRKRREDGASDGRIPIGFYTKSGDICYLPIVTGLTVLISGRQGSGKRNLLRVIETMSEGIADSTEGIESVWLSCGMRIVIYDDKLPFNILSDLKKEAGEDPFVIHLGGAIDRQNLADYSYIPYSKQMVVLSPGNGIVRKNSVIQDYGEIVIPKV